MARCADCAHYPWVPGADPGMLPAHGCHPDLPWRRWTAESRDAERDCQYFEPRESVKQPEEKPETKPRKKG